MELPSCGDTRPDERIPRPFATALSLAFLLAVVASALFVTPGWGQEAELSGEVVRVDGWDVRIEITSQLWPRVGDKLQLGQMMPGFDQLVTMAGEWTITEVTPDYVLAEAGPGVVKAPAREYLAIIRSANPQPRPAAGTGSGTGGPGTGVAGGGDGGKDSGDVINEVLDLDEVTALYENLLEMLDASDPEGEELVETVRQEILARANAGDPEAQNQMGVYYIDGVGVERNAEEAARWYQLAAEQGSARGQRRLGRMYQTGSGVPEDPVEAVRLYRLAAAQGNAAAHNDLGVMYAEGRGVDADINEALRWFRLAAEMEYDWGFANQAIIYERGLAGATVDRALAIQNYQAAARLGHQGAQEWLRGQGLNW
jgi:hypothetical protein